MPTKDKRLQIRVTDQELAGIQRRARAKGLSVAEYGRSRLLFGDDTVLTEQVSLGLDSALEVLEEVAVQISDQKPKTDDGPNYAAADDDDDAFLEQITEHMTKAIENPGVVSARESFTISKEDYERMIEECEVKDLPPGVRCIKCGFVHGP